MLKKLIPIIPIVLSIFVVILVLSCAVFVKPEPVVPVQPVVENVVNNDVVSPTTIPTSIPGDMPEGMIRKILFAHMNGFSSIWLMNDDGSDLEQIISENIGNSYSAVLSPKKDKIAYISIEASEEISPSSSRPKTFGIRIIDLATNESTLIVSRDKDQAGIGHPKFSPDGNYLAYLIQKNKKSTLYITNLSNLTTNKVIEFTSVYKVSAGEINICWSPDGKKIAYLHDNNICITDLNGNTRKIISGGDPEKGEDLSGNKWDIFTIGNLSFSSDGKQIKYTKGNERFIVEINGENNTQLTNLEEILTSLRVDENKYVSIVGLVPNSNKVLILESWPKGQDPYIQKLLLYDIDSKETKIIYEGNKYYNPTISPDGKFIAVSIDISNNEDESGMYFMDLNGENLRKITSVSYYEILEWK